MTTLNDFLQMLELGSLKGVLTALLLPPLPLILLTWIGALMLRRKRVVAGWLVIVLASALLWLSTTSGAAKLLTQALLRPPPVLSAGAMQDLKAIAAAQKTAIVVLGGGRERHAPEYAMSTLSPTSVERLRYGIWLSRATGLPIAFAGGVGHGADEGPTEAEIAARIAREEFGRPLRWTEPRSRDTQENAQFTVLLLRDAGIERIVLVTHGFHMPRALAAFERAARRQGTALSILPAPMDMSARPVGWWPSADGFARTRAVLREALGSLAGA